MRAFGVSSEALLVGYGVADRIPGAAYNWSPHLKCFRGGSRSGYYRLIGVRILLTTLVRWLINAPVPAIAPADCANGPISPWLNPAIYFRAGFCGGMDINRCCIGICESGDR